MPPPHVGMITGSSAELQGTSGLWGWVWELWHRGSEFPEAIVWGNSAKAPSWPGRANLGPNEIKSGGGGGSCSFNL